MLKTTTFASAHHLETTLQRYLHLYNQHIPQKKHVTPVAKLKEHYHTKPALFQKRPINHPGPDSYISRIVSRNWGRSSNPSRYCTMRPSGEMSTEVGVRRTLSNSRAMRA